MQYYHLVGVNPEIFNGIFRAHGGHNTQNMCNILFFLLCLNSVLKERRTKLHTIFLIINHGIGTVAVQLKENSEEIICVRLVSDNVNDNLSFAVIRSRIEAATLKRLCVQSDRYCMWTMRWLTRFRGSLLHILSRQFVTETSSKIRKKEVVCPTTISRNTWPFFSFSPRNTTEFCVLVNEKNKIN